MLPKKNRVNKAEVEKIFKNGRFLNSESLTFKFLKVNKNTKPQISFIAPKTLAKGAVERNRLRRRGYIALQKSINQFPDGFMGVFIFKKIISSQETEDEIKTILNKIN